MNRNKLLLLIIPMFFLCLSACKEKKRHEWKSVIKNFHDQKLNEIKSYNFNKNFKGSIIYGSGKIDRVGVCGFTDHSDKYGKECVFIQLFDNDYSAKLYIYYPKSKSAQIANYNERDHFNFDDCIANHMTMWGFWSTATCDAD